MATFLKLCQDVARESGVVANIGDPSSVEGQVGRLARVVHWTDRAWHDIQIMRQDWRWMQAEFEGTAVVNTRRYAGDDLSATRFSRWVVPDDCGDIDWTVQKVGEARSTEGFLRCMDWPEFRRRYLIGSEAERQGAPVVMAIDPNQKVALHPIPDAEYTIRGTYRKAPQPLVVNTDVPEMPEEFHPAITWRALIFMGQFDEAVNQQPAWVAEFAKVMSHLLPHQTPKVSLGGALA